MANPTPYTVSYSFSGFQANNPTTPLPAASLDNELANAATAIAETIEALKDLRRSDGALVNGIVTFDSLEAGLQFTIDPTNGALVAAAVTGAEAAAATATAGAATATTQAGIATTQAAAAAASAGSINLTLYLPKAGNLAGIGSADTARANLNAAKVDGSDMTGRLAPLAGTAYVTNWNNADTNGYFSSEPGATNAPDASNYWLVLVAAVDPFNVMQIAYPYGLAAISVASVAPMRRHAYNSGVRTWTAWESMSPVPVGSTIWVNGTAAPPGYLKENGALVSRASFPRLYAHAAASGNIVNEASWSGGNSGAFSTGDLSTTFRLPDSRGEFVRGWDDSRGVDSGRSIGSTQADSLKDHTHNYGQWSIGAQAGNTAGYYGMTTNTTTPTATGSPSTGAATETRPRNIAKLACIKY